MIFTAFLVMAGIAQASGSGSAPDVRCGSYCLFVALQALGIGPPSFTKLEADLGLPGPSGYSMFELQHFAEAAGAKTLAVETSLENLKFRERPFACIGIVNGDHFVLINDVTASRVSVTDPPRSYETSLDAFRNMWDGKALLISNSSLTSEVSVKRRRLVVELLPRVSVGFLAAAVASVAAYFVRRKLRGPKVASRSGRLALSCLMLLPLAGGCDSSAGTPSPKAEAKPSDRRWISIGAGSKDLGTIIKRVGQQEERFEVRLENHGSGILNITGIRTSCGCTRATVSPRAIPPGGTATLTASVKVGDNLATNGARIYIQSSDPFAHEREFAVNWLVDVPIRTEETSLSLPPLDPGATAERTLPILAKGLALCNACRLQVRSGSQTTSSTVSSKPGGRSRTHDEVSPSGASRVVGTLSVGLKGQTEENYYKDFIHISLLCGDVQRASFTLPVSWSVASVVQAAPSRIYFGETAPGELNTRMVALRSRSGKPFHLLALESQGLVSFDAPSTTDFDSTHHLQISVTAPAAEGPWRQVAFIRTDHEGSGDIELGFSGIVKCRGGNQ